MQNGFPAGVGFPSLSSLMKYNLDPSTYSGFVFSASMIARCSAWIQHVLSVTFPAYSSFFLEHFLCDSSSAGGELYPIPITMICSIPSKNSLFVIIVPHRDRWHVESIAICVAVAIHSNACRSSSPVR